jgi:hypothetical protein
MQTPSAILQFCKGIQSEVSGGGGMDFVIALGMNP